MTEQLLKRVMWVCVVAENERERIERKIGLDTVTKTRGSKTEAQSKKCECCGWASERYLERIEDGAKNRESTEQLELEDKMMQFSPGGVVPSSFLKSVFQTKLEYRGTYFQG